MPVPRASSSLFVVAALAAVGAVGAGAQDGVVYGAAYDSIRGGPLTGATVFLWQTSHRAVTDAEGRYRMVGVRPGRYSVVFSHMRLDELGVSLGPRPISVAALDSTRVDLGTPSTFTLVASQCFREQFISGTGVVAGRVADGDTGIGLPGSQVTLSWDVPGTRDPDRLTLRTDYNGWFRTCTAPADTPIALTAHFLNRQGASREISVAEHGVVEAGFLLFALEPSSVSGRLLDASAGAPVAEAVVWLRGTSFRGLTDGGGRFTMEGVPPGTYMLMSEHLVYGTKMDTLEVPSGRRVAVEMMLDTRAVEIAPITVTVEAVSLPDRARGGVHITAAAVDGVRDLARDVADLVRAQHISGVIVQRGEDGSLCIGSVPGQVRMRFTSACVPMVIFLNGTRTTNTDMVLQISPAAVDRMVIYRPVEAGSLFGLGGASGVLEIYTKGN